MAQDQMLNIFKENYFTTGCPLNTAPDWDTNDLTFQVSVRFNIYQDRGWKLFWGFTDMSVWEVYKPSNPFKASTYTNGLYVCPAVREGNDLLFGYEHRSNGYDGYLSRSLDYLFCTYTRTFNDLFSAQATGRFGIGSIGNDYSLEMFDRYEGYVNAAACFHTRDRRLLVSTSVTPLFRGDIPANVSAELAYRPTRDLDWFYLTVRYHHGYDEDQLDCAMPGVLLKHMVRVGLSIQPSRISHKMFF